MDKLIANIDKIGHKLEAEWHPFWHAETKPLSEIYGLTAKQLEQFMEFHRQAWTRRRWQQPDGLEE